MNGKILNRAEGGQMYGRLFHERGEVHDYIYFE